MLARFIQVVLAYFWSAFALVVLASAVFVSAVRLMLPHIGDYRDEIESWVSTYMTQPVEIDVIAAKWHGWTPHLRLTGIRLLDATETRVLTRFDQADLSVDLFATIVHRELVPGTLTVSGVELTLLRRPNGAITIEGVAPESVELPSMRRNALAYWLQNQKNLAIESAKISWRDEESLLKPVVFSDVSLSIRSRGQHRQLEGSAHLPSDMGEDFNFLLDIEGDLLTDDWAGDLYIEGKAIDPSAVLNYSRWMGLKLTEGKLGFQIWSRWAGARLLSIDGKVTVDGVEIGVDDYLVQVTEGTGDLHAIRNTQGRWSMSLERLNITTPDGSWPETELFLSLTRSPTSDLINIVAQATFLRLDDLAPVIPNLGFIPDSIQASIQKTQPRGDIRNLRVGYFPERPSEQRFYLHSEFSDISMNPVSEIPGLYGLRGAIKADASGGELTLASTGLSIDLGDRQDAPIVFDRLHGNIRWVTRRHGWWLATNSLIAETRALHTETTGTLEWGDDDSPVANLITTVLHGDLEYLPELIPNDALPKRGYDWLQMALTGGTITSGLAVVRGPLKRFPFDGTDGVFKARLTVEEGLLDFHKAWPRLEELNAELIFDGRQMFFNANNAKMLDTHLYDIATTIPDLTVKRRVFTGTTKAKFSADQGLAVVNASPMHRSIGERLQELEIAGPMNLDLGMTIPLKFGHKPTSKGTLHFDDGMVKSEQMKVTLENIQGQLLFINKDWNITDTSARYLDQAVAVTGVGGPEEGGSRDELRLRGRVGVETIHRQLEIVAPSMTNWLETQSLFARLRGSAEWNASIVMKHTHSGATSTKTLALDSDLKGLVLDVPSPIGKGAEQSRHLHLKAGPIAERLNTITFDYADVLAGHLVVRKDDAGEKKLINATLTFSEPLLSDTPPPGITVSGTLSQFSLDAWLAIMRGDHKDAKQNALQSIRPPLPTNIDIQLGALRVLGQDFEDVGFHLRSDEDTWQAHLSGTDIQGSISTPFALDGARVTGQFDHLTLAKSAPDYVGLDIEPIKLPTLEFNADSFRFENAEMGSLQLLTFPTESGLRLEQLAFTADDFVIETKGDWYTDAAGQHSQIQLDVQGKDLGELLNTFGYDGAAINGGNTNLQLLAEWPGAPSDFSLDSLEGDLRIEVKQGTLLDVNPRVGRLFGLLSMQALRRRLMLDFKDLFGKGFAFDRIEGTFELDRGDAYTNNLSMDGPSARVDITGRTGLTNQDYDQLVTVTPQLSSSLPVAGAFFGPAGAGVGAALFLGQKMFKGLPNQLLQRQYTVTGNWDEPVIERIRKRRSTDVEVDVEEEPPLSTAGES